MRGLDTHVIQIELILIRFLYRQAQHDTGSQLDEVYLQHLAHERERTAGTKVTLDHLDLIALRQILDIERTGDIQLLSDLLTDTLDTPNRLHI